MQKYATPKKTSERYNFYYINRSSNGLCTIESIQDSAVGLSAWYPSIYLYIHFRDSNFGALTYVFIQEGMLLEINGVGNFYDQSVLNIVLNFQKIVVLIQVQKLYSGKADYYIS